MMRTLHHIMMIVLVAVFLSGCSATWKEERELRRAEAKRVMERETLEAFAALMARHYPYSDD